MNKMAGFVGTHPRSTAFLAVYYILTIVLSFKAGRPVKGCADCGMELFGLVAIWLFISFCFAGALTFRLIDRPALRTNYFVLMGLALLPSLWLCVLWLR
jgi:hypothetical protein